MAGAYNRYRTDRAEQSNRQYSQGLLGKLMGGGIGGAGGGFPAAPAPSTGGGQTASPSGAQAASTNPNVGSTIDFARANSPTSSVALAGNVRGGKGWTEIVMPDGKVVRREGSRNWRNNNPGNIEFGPFAQNAGAIGSDGRFAVFPTYEAGRAAKAKLLFESPNYRDKTIAGAINRYAPPFENNTNAYTGAVAAAIGVDPNTPISALSPQQREIMLDAMQKVEGFKQGRETVNGQAMAYAPDNVQVASLDPSAGVAEATSRPIPPEYGVSPEQWAAMNAPDGAVQTAGLSVGPASGGPITPELMQPTSISGGQPLPMQGVPQPPQQVAQVAPVQQAQGIDPTVMEALTSPYADDTVKGIAELLFKQQMERNDPMRQLQMEQLRLETESLRNPQPSFSDKISRERLDWEKANAGRTTDISEFEYGQRNPEFFDRQEQLKRAGATNVTVGGGSDKQVFDRMSENATSAQSIASGLASLQEAKRAVDGGIISGAGADYILGLRKVASALGIGDASTIVNTETFRSSIAPQVAAIMKATVGSTQISNADREFAEKAAGGSINLDQGTIKRLVGIMERGARVAIKRHNDILDKVYPQTPDGKFERERALFGVQEPPGTEAAPVGIDPALWNVMTPEEKALFGPQAPKRRKQTKATKGPDGSWIIETDE